MRPTTALKMSYKRIYFIRHGQSEANAAKDRTGNPNDSLSVRDAKLTELGQAQASCWNTPNALTQVYDNEPPEIVICSPLRRAMETASLAFENTEIPIVCSRYPRERWWNHYQCVGSEHEETINFANTLSKSIGKLEELTTTDQFWNPELELKEIMLDRDENNVSKSGLYDPSEREAIAQGMEATKEFLKARPETVIAVACHWGVINALTDVSPNNCDIVATDLDIETGEILVLQTFEPPGDVEKSI